MDEGYIDNIAVREEYRRQGVGEALLGAFLRFGKEHLAFLTLEVRPSNTPAIQFYLKHGLCPGGQKKKLLQRAPGGRDFNDLGVCTWN